MQHGEEAGYGVKKGAGEHYLRVIISIATELIHINNINTY